MPTDAYELLTDSLRLDIVLLLQLAGEAVSDERHAAIRRYERHRKRTRKRHFVTQGSLDIREIQARINSDLPKLIAFKRASSDPSVLNRTSWSKVVRDFLAYIKLEHDTIAYCFTQMLDWEKFSDNKRQLFVAILGIWVAAISLFATLLFDHWKEISTLVREVPRVAACAVAPTFYCWKVI